MIGNIPWGSEIESQDVGWQQPGATMGDWKLEMGLGRNVETFRFRCVDDLQSPAPVSRQNLC